MVGNRIEFPVPEMLPVEKLAYHVFAHIEVEDLADDAEAAEPRLFFRHRLFEELQDSRGKERESRVYDLLYDLIEGIRGLDQLLGHKLRKNRAFPLVEYAGKEGSDERIKALVGWQRRVAAEVRELLPSDLSPQGLKDRQIEMFLPAKVIIDRGNVDARPPAYSPDSRVLIA